VNYFSEEERQDMRQQLQGGGMVPQPLQMAAPMPQDAAAMPPMQGGMPTMPPPVAALPQGLGQVPQSPTRLQKLAAVLRGASRRP